MGKALHCGDRPFEVLHVGGGLYVQRDTGCDWARYDARFGRCLTCPLERCRHDMSSAESAQVHRRLVRLAAGEPAEALALR